MPGLRGRWLAQDVHDPDGGFAVSVWDSLEAMQPFFVGEYTTYRCEVKYEQ